MSELQLKEIIEKQIQKIKKQKEDGWTDRDIIDSNQFYITALRACGIPVSYLIPKAEAQDMSLQEWDTHTNTKHKWVYYDDMPIRNIGILDRMLIGLMYSIGFKHLVEILPEESRSELIQIVKTVDARKRMFSRMENRRRLYTIGKESICILGSYGKGDYFEHSDCIPHRHLCEIKLLNRSLRKYCPFKGKLSDDEKECDYCEHFIVIDFVKNTEATKIFKVHRPNEKE